MSSGLQARDEVDGSMPRLAMRPVSGGLTPVHHRTAPLVPPSKTVLRLFSGYLQFFVRRHFHGMRLAGAEHWPGTGTPLVICLNHASWWDPLTSILLSRHLDKSLDHYAPMDALACERYGFLTKLGLFPVQQGTPRGGAQFLRTAAQIFNDRNAVLWMTPQGGFTDVRTRPVVFRAGLDALVRRAKQVTVLPLAIEYTFWNERLPEALALLGAPLTFRQGRLVGDECVLNNPGEQVAEALAHTQDALALLAAKRDPSLFTSVLAGLSGTGGVYGGWQRARAFVRGERFEPEHGSLQTQVDRSDA